MLKVYQSETARLQYTVSLRHKMGYGVLFVLALIYAAVFYGVIAWVGYELIRAAVINSFGF